MRFGIVQDGCSKWVGLIVRKINPTPCSSLCPFTAGTLQCCFEVENLDTEDNRNQSEIVKGLSWPAIPVSGM